MSSPSSETGPLGRLRQFLSFLGPAQQAAPTKKSIHFGGGNIGRGFVAEFLHKSGYEVVFVDVMDSLIEKLQNATSYKVIELGSDANDQHTFVIDNFRAINSKHEGQKVIDEISTADTVTCAVGPNILKFIAEPIAKGILARKESSPPLAVIACENMIGATTALKELILSKVQPEEKAIIERNARFANSAIDRIVPKQDPDAGLDVKIEKFYEWCVESEPFQGQVPDIQGVHFVDNLEPYIERKLYTVNTAHATAAYYGYNRGKTFIHEAMKDAEIRQLVVDTLEETAALIVEKHGIAKDEQQRYVDNILERISAEFFEDEATRVGRAPIRKLGLKERFVGPAKQISKRGGSYSHLLGGIEMALRFQNVQGDDESAELARLLAEAKDEQGGAERITEQLTGLTSDEYQQLYGEVVDIVKRVQADLS